MTSNALPKGRKPPPKRPEPPAALRSIRLHLMIGLTIVVVLAGGLGGWASTAQISGALIAPG
jgi:HlyD family secretion protein